MLTNVALFGEGVDCPNLGAVILLRPTASLALWLQQIGRVLRPSPGKQRAVLLDFVGNVSRHGLPDAPRQSSLDSKPRRGREKSDPGLRKCSVCSALNRSGLHECSECGADLRTPRERREIEIKLEQARQREEEDAVSLMSYREALTWAGGDERRLRTICRLRGYNSGWFWHQLNGARLRVEGVRA